MYEVFLAALINNPLVTLQYLSEKDPNNEVLTRLLQYSEIGLKTGEQRKLVTICFTNLMTLDELPDFVRVQTKSLIHNCVKQLVITQKRKAKQIKSKEQNDIQDDSESDDSLLDSEDEDSDEEINTLAGKNYGSLDDDEDEAIEAMVQLQTSYNLMKTKFNAFDEFTYFQNVM